MLIDDLTKKERDICAELTAVRKEIKAEQIRLASDKYGVEVGSIVKDRNGNEHKVIEIDARFGKPWLVGNPKKQDGSWGIARRNIYGDWELLAK